MTSSRVHGQNSATDSKAPGVIFKTSSVWSAAQNVVLTPPASAGFAQFGLPFALPSSKKWRPIVAPSSAV